MIDQIIQKQQQSPVISLRDAFIILDTKYPITETKPISICQKRKQNGDTKPKCELQQKSRRPSVMWSVEEQEFLLNGYRKFSNCWTQILKEYPMNPVRIRFDLKDKWKNLIQKENDPECAKIFQNINECNEQRRQILSKGTPFFILGGDAEPPKREKDALLETVQRIRCKMEELIPRRHQSLIFAHLHNPVLQGEIIREWLVVDENPCLVFDFIAKYR